MIVNSYRDVEETQIKTFPYKGKQYEVKDVFIRWLSTVGPSGEAEYGLRFFRIGVGGEIPIHNHFYHQTMYILTGTALCRCHDPESGEITQEKETGPGDYVYLSSMEVHSMKNVGPDEVTFLCCIANVYEDD